MAAKLTYAKAMIWRRIGVVMPSDQIQIPLLSDITLYYSLCLMFLCFHFPSVGLETKGGNGYTTYLNCDT